MFWTGSGFKVIMEPNHNKIAKAIKRVEMAMDGRIGFCYKRVKRYPLHSYGIRNDIEVLKRERNSCITISDRVLVITTQLDKLRDKEKQFWLYDQETHDLMYKEYKQLQKDLALLFNEGEIDGYTILPTGRLEVTWFTERSTTELQVIEQGFTYAIFRDEAPKDINIIPAARAVPVITVEEIMHRHRENLPQIGMANARKQTDLHNHLSNKNVGDYTITDGAGQLKKVYKERKPGGDFDNPPPAPFALDPEGFKGKIEDTSQDREEWRKKAMLNYIGWMFAAYLIHNTPNKGQLINVKG